MLLTKLIFQPYSAVYEQFAMQKQDLKIDIYIYIYILPTIRKSSQQPKLNR